MADHKTEQPLRHHHYPKTEAEYEAELTETEVEYEQKIEAVEEKTQVQALRYILWGSISVVVNVGVFYLGYHVLGIEYQIANLIAWVISVQCSFWIDRIFVFKHKSKYPFQEMGKFYGTRIVTYLIESLILFLGISLLGMPGTITKVIGNGLALVGNFFFSKLFVFRNHKQAES